MLHPHAVQRKFIVVLSLVFICIQPFLLRGDKSRQVPAARISASAAPAPAKKLRTPPLRISIPQSRLLAQTRQTTPNAQGNVVHPNGTSSPAGPDDPTDPFVVAEATALNKNPSTIYAFVRDQIHFEAYRGSVRGARGTLWAMAGNTLDKASLLTALLQASGFTTQYEHTSLGGNNAEVALIRTMFPQTPVLLGCVPSGVGQTDPGYSNYANPDSSDYYWVEYGPSKIDLDPNLPNGQPGQTLQAPDANFTTIPATLQQQVTVNVNAEQYSQAGSLFGLGPTTTTVLSQQFYTWALVGNIVSVGYLVQGTAAGGLDISATTFTYTPYLLIGSGGPDVSQDTIVTGTDFQELYTNFPLGSTVLTGLFVEIDAEEDWGYSVQKYTHTMFDRLGPAARQGNASVQISLPATPTPAVSDFDIAAFNILPTRQSLGAFQSQQTRINNAYNNYEAIKPAFESLPTTGTLSAAQQTTAQQAATLAKYLLIAENELTTMAYDGAEDQLIPQLETGYYVHVYSTAPRVTVGASSMDAAGDAIFSLDVLKNDMRVIPGFGQTNAAANYEEVARGMITTIIEASVLSGVTGQQALDIGTVMTALGDPNQLIALGPQTNGLIPTDPGVLTSTNLSADAQTLILNATQNGNEVITPNQMVTINGVSTVGWWESDQYGHTVSHFPNGYHQAISEYAAVNAFAIAYNKPIAKMIGNVEGAGLVGYAFAAGVLQGISTSSSFTGILKAGKVAGSGVSTGNLSSNLSKFFSNLNKILKKLNLPEADKLGTTLIGEFASGLKQGITRMENLLMSILGVDPEVPDYLTTPLTGLPTGVTPGASPGVTMSIATDPLYTLPYNGNELPVYDAFITNTGPATDTFRFSTYNPQGQFVSSPTFSYLTLLPGQAGEVNYCAQPYDPTGITLPTVGSAEQLQLTATSTTSGATASATANYTMPAVPSLSFSVDPQVLTVVPGGTVSATIAIGSTGNAAAGAVTLTAAADTGITMNGLTSPVTVPLNGVVTLPVSFTAAANAANNTYYAVLTAAYAGAGGTQSVNFSVPVNVAALGSCSLSTSLTATQAGMTSLGNILQNLANDMNAAAGAPSNAALVSRIGGDVAAVNNSLAQSYLQSFSASLTAANSAVASATPGTLLSALSGLDAAICPIGAAINQASTYNTQMSLSPNSLVTGPNLAATFTIRMTNSTSSLKVYSLSVTGVPSGVTSSFSSPSVTLGPYGSPTYSNNSLTLTLTPGASFTTPFTFNVVATPVGAPEFAISAPGSLLVRPQAVSIDNIIATPAYGPPGTQFLITARVFAEVNQDAQAYLQLQPYNAAGTAVTAQRLSSSFTLSSTSTLQNVTIGTVDSTGLANGAYTLAVTGLYSGSIPIQGATGTGSILVGAPLSGTLSANANSTPPGTVPPGNSAVQVALNITRDTTPNPISTLVGSVALSGISKSMVLYQNGAQQLAYACSDSYVNIVDVTNPASPQVLGTFGHDVLTTEDGQTVSGYQTVACAIYNTDFIMSYSRYNGNTSANPIPTHFATYSLANPLAPALVGSVVDLARSDSAGLYVAGNTALMYQSDVIYNPYSNFITGQNGDIYSADLTTAGSNGNVNFLNDVFSCGGLTGNQCNNVTNVPNASLVSGVCVVNGTTAIPNDPTKGGPYRLFAGTAVNSTTSYFGSSDSYGGNIENPTCPTIHGQLLVVDTTTPSAPAITSRVTDSAMAFMTDVAVQGNTAIAVGDSTGIYDINSGFVGTLVISSFDISTPTNPVLLNSVTTQLADKAGSFIVSLGNNTFAVGNTTNNGKAELVLVDASTPTALRYVPYDATFVANPTIAQNGYFFALSATPASTTNALSVFQLSQVTGPQITVKLQLPKTGGTSVNANSFSLAPSSVTTGTTFDTYEWDQPTPNTISFTMNVTGVNPGDVPTVVVGGEMDYTLPSLGSGVFVLGPLTALCQQILSIAPDGQNVNFAGNSATYAVTVNNPTTTQQTFVPSTLGIPASWGVQLPASITVAAGSSQSFNLVLTSATSAVPGYYKFFVFVTTPSGITASVGDTMGISSPTTQGSNPSVQAFSFTASASPSQITVGPGGSGTFQILVTDTGNVAASPTFLYPNLPSGWGITFTPSASPNLLPGLANSQITSVTVTSAPFNYDQSPGATQITLPLQYGSTTLNLTLTVNVVANGVTGYMSPGVGPSTGTFTLNLTNSGSVQDTYSLAVIGPLAQVASIAASSGAIASHVTATIPITLNPVNYLPPGNYPLQIQAISQGNSLVKAVISGTVQVGASKSVSAAVKPATASVPTTPGSAALLLQANNTGNAPDTYTAAITGTTGPVTATLNGSGQTIALFAIPALGNSEFPLDVQVTGPGTATVTVTVTSTTDSTIHGQATVTINNSTPPPPTAVASPTQANTPLHRLADLDASGSSDSSNLGLTYLWTLTSAPAGSAVTSSSIALATSAIAAFRPDVPGAYSFNVLVSNGTTSANATATYTAIDAVPVALAGNPSNAAVGTLAFLNGKNSYDPDGQPITFAWTLVSAPTGSALTAASIGSSQTPAPFFTPDVAGAYQFQLIVSDATAPSLPATVTVTAYSGTVPPNADAGRSQNVALHAPATVNGSASVDPNSSPLTLNYLWSLATVPSGSAATLANPTNASTQFTPDVAGDYTVNLVVSNAHGTSQTASTIVHVFSGDVPPNANSGGNQFVLPTGTANLSGAASADPDNGPLNLGFLWWLNSLPSSSAATLQNANTATPQFVADKSGYYIARLEANDGLLAGFSNTLITAAATCDADANGVINQTDIAIIQAALGQSALANDPRDFNKDGQITSADVTGCSALVVSGAPALQISPTSFSETLKQNSDAAMQTLQVSSSGNPITFTVSSNQNWLTSSVSSSSTASIGSLSAIVNPAGLSPATYQGMLTFTPSSGVAQTVSVTLVVTSSNKCDVNLDGVVNVADVQRIINEALGLAPAINDLNQDGVVNVADVQIVINAALGLGCSAK